MADYLGPSLFRKVSANVNAAVRYLKLFDKATTPVNGTDTPIMTIPLPASGAPLNLDFSANPIIFKFGLGMSLVTGAADSNTTAPAASEQVVHVFYD